MLDHIIDMLEDWQSAWLEREYLPLLYYMAVFSLLMSFATSVLGVIGSIKLRRCRKQLDAAEPAERESIATELNKKSLKITKGLLFVASIYLFHALAITLVDAVISFFTLKKDMASDPSAWTTELLIELALYCLFLLVIFTAAFFLFPLLQLLLAAKAAARWHENTPRAQILLQSRFSSTQFANMWCILAYVIVGFWSAGYHPLWRYVALEASLGSALVWLEVGIILNFSEIKIQREDLTILRSGPSNMRETFVIFKNTIEAYHSKPRAADELPIYEKEPLLDADTTA